MKTPGVATLVSIFGKTKEVRRCAAIFEGLGRSIDVLMDVGEDEDALCEWMSRSLVGDADLGLAFFAWGPEKLNTLRCKGASHLNRLGYRLISGISRDSIVAPDATIGANTLIGPGAIVESGVRVADNCVIESGAIIGMGAQIEHSSWIGPGAMIGPTARIGRFTTLGSRVCVVEEAVIGEMCQLLIPAQYPRDVPDRSFFNPRFEDVVQIHRGTSEPARAF